MTELFQFRWEVSKSGHHVIKALDMSAPDNEIEFLTDDVPFGTIYNRKVYLPLEDRTGLFKDFAAIELKKPAILSFADLYGRLGEREQWIALSDHPVKGKDGSVANLAGSGEPLYTWFDQIARMRDAVQLWDAIRKLDKDALAKVIVWDTATDSVQYRYNAPMKGGHTLARKTDFEPGASERFRHRDLVEPATYALQQIINKELTPRVAAKLLRDPSRGRLGIHVVPVNLLGALWLQFANAIHGRKEYRQCAQCRTWFEVGTNSRADKNSCSNACRQRAYRNRKEDALRLVTTGMPIKTVASKLKTEAATVRKWANEKMRSRSNRSMKGDHSYG